MTPAKVDGPSSRNLRKKVVRGRRHSEKKLSTPPVPQFGHTELERTQTGSSPKSKHVGRPRTTATRCQKGRPPTSFLRKETTTEKNPTDPKHHQRRTKGGGGGDCLQVRNKRSTDQGAKSQWGVPSKKGGDYIITSREGGSSSHLKTRGEGGAEVRLQAARSK